MESFDNGSMDLVTALVATALAIVATLAILAAILDRSTATNHLCRQEDTRYFR